MSEREKEVSGSDVRLTVTLLKRHECGGRRRLGGDKRQGSEEKRVSQRQDADVEIYGKKSNNVCSCHFYCLEGCFQNFQCVASIKSEWSDLGVILMRK